MYRQLISFFILIYVIPAFCMKLDLDGYSTEFEQNIAHNIVSDPTFTNLSLEEKQLFLNALLYRFTDAALEMAELQIKEKIIFDFQQKQIDIAKTLKSVKNFKKITELRNVMHTAKKECFSYLKHNSKPVLTALEQVKEMGRNVTIQQTSILEQELDMHNKQLSNIISSMLQHFATLQQKLEAPLENNEDIPLSIIKFSNVIDIAGQLENSCQNIHTIAQSHLPLLKSVMQAGLVIVNTYYKLVRNQLCDENGAEFCQIKFNMFFQQKNFHYLPPDLVQFYNELITIM